jgi:hypothetical protein
MEIKTYVKFQQVRGCKSTHDELIDSLTKYDLNWMLCFLGGMNLTLFGPEHDKIEALQNDFVNRFIAEDIQDEVRRLGGQVFHRAQLLFLMCEAIQYCPDRPSEEFHTYLSTEIGDLCLMANDHVHLTITEPAQTPTMDRLTLILNFIPIVEAHAYRNPLLKLARVRKMTADIAPLYENSKSFFDLPEEFQKATGISLQTFEALMAASITITASTNKTELHGYVPKPISISIFDRYGLDSEMRDSFFRLISASTDEFREKCKQSPSRLLYDHTILRDRPYLASQGYIRPLDHSLILEKFESTIFWKIIRNLPRGEGNRLLSFWGKLFEGYITWLLEISVDGMHNALFPDPRYCDKTNDQVCDAIITCGQTAIFLECKANVISSGSKYSSDPSRLGQELELKFVGTSADPKGVRQLVSAIKSTLASPARRALGLDLDNIGCVIPLLVTKDDLGDGIGVNAYLSERFAEIGAEENLSRSLGPRIRCLPLQSICADVLEKISPHLKRTRFAAILAERMKMDPTLRAPFFNYENGELRPGMDTIPALRAVLSQVSQLVPRVLDVPTEPVP